MADLGLCVTPDFLPSADELRALRPAFLRSILYRLDDLDRLLGTGLPLFVTLNNQAAEVRGDWSGWDGAVAELALRAEGRLLGVGCGNEFDLYWARNPADVPPAFAADLALRASAILRPAGIRVYPTSVAGPLWQEYLAELSDLLGDHVDGYDLHPYGQRPDGWGSPGWAHGDLRVAIARAHELAGGRPIVCSEYGVKVGDAGGEQQQAAFLAAGARTLDALGAAVPLCAWFAWHDLVGAPDERGAAAFGLVAEDDRARPAWHAFAALARGPIVQPAPVPTPAPTLPTVEVIPMADLTRWQGKVGSGLLAMMAEDGTEPAMESEWRPFNRPSGAPATVEQSIGANGTQYVWLLGPNKGFRFPPDPATAA